MNAAVTGAAPVEGESAQTNSAATAGVPATESTKIAQFALGLTIEAVPPAVLELAKEHLLDALGIAIASSGFDFGRVALQGVRELGDGTQATAIGSGTKLPAASAALVNGLLAHGLDFDDTHIGAIYHASSPALGAALPAGQANSASGEEVLLAVTVALEVGCRLATAGAGEFHHRGFHPTALCGTFAAATAAGRLYKVDQQSLVSSLGLCGSQAAGILVRSSNTWLKRMHPGWAAHSALVAVALGRAGFIGPDTVFEGAGGFYSSHLQRIPEGTSLPTYQLGETWQTLGIALKPYPCCHFIHSFVDAALELRGQFDLADIEHIDCLLSKDLHAMVAEPRADVIRPANAYRALFSVPYVVALALTRGRVDLAAFYDEPLDAADVLDVAGKTYCINDPASDFPAHFPGEVVVQLKDGRVLRSRKAASLGTPDLPLSRSSLEAKFVSNATRVISRTSADRLIDAVLNLEKASSLDEIMALATA